jgi:lipoyl(octanoyl) transferase
LAGFGIEAFTKDRMIGIWVKHNNLDKKIAAIGVRVKKWVTYHGIAVNISTDLSKFDGITPCGITEYGVTSMQELGVNCTFEEFDDALKYNFQKIFGRIIVNASSCNDIEDPLVRIVRIASLS